MMPTPLDGRLDQSLSRPNRKGQRARTASRRRKCRLRPPTSRWRRQASSRKEAEPARPLGSARSTPTIADLPQVDGEQLSRVGINTFRPSEERKRNMAAQIKPSIVFCHGLWADGSLLQQGHARLAGRRARGDRRPVRDWTPMRRTWRRSNARWAGSKAAAILVGHSYGVRHHDSPAPERERAAWLGTGVTSPPSPRTSARPCRVNSTSTRPTYSAMSRSRTAAPGCCRQASSILRETFPRRSRSLVVGDPLCAGSGPASKQQKLDRTPWKSKPSWSSWPRTTTPCIRTFSVSWQKAGCRIRLKATTLARRQPLVRRQAFGDDVEGLHVEGVDRHLRDAEEARVVEGADLQDHQRHDGAVGW